MPTLLFAHATGLCKEIWGSVIRDLMDIPTPMNWLSLDFRGHGDSVNVDLQETHVHPWHEGLVGDLESVLEATRTHDGIHEPLIGNGPLIGIGHSSGGASLVHFERKHPQAFASLLLMEPILFPPHLLEPPFTKLGERGAMAKQALRRRAKWLDHATARTYFASKFYGAWDQSCFEDYLA